VEKLDLLVELGSEEIPASYLEPAAEALRRNVAQWLRDRHLDFDETRMRSFATPRRLAVRAPGVSAAQETREETRLGPAVKAAFDDQGRPTKAAQGFARGAGIDVDRLERVETDRGERVAAVVRVGGRSARELLLEDGVLESWAQLPFPKTMRWIPGDDFRYARPLRWVVLLLGEEVVPARLRSLVAGRESRGHRTLSPGKVEIGRPADYETILGDHGVWVLPERRRQSIEEGARSEARSLGGTPHEDPGLLAEITYLAEHPQVLHGSFDPALVDELPPEVIVTAMRAHQRYFSVVGPDGRLLPHFLTFRDGDTRSLDQVAAGNERVLRARLDDARFYWNEDRERSSDEKLAELERIVWLEGFGSVADKCRRVARSALDLRRTWSLETVPEDLLERACLLCKSDLATEMIRDGKEFTKLQGTMGRYYALESGEAPEVADAIAEHLYPRHASDRLPEGELATLVAVADRLDSIAGSLLAGFAPTGSQDPYALRRQSLAILRILLERQWHLDLGDAIHAAVALYTEDPQASETVVQQSSELFGGRIESILSELPAEIVRAVLAVRRVDPVAIVGAARSLAESSGSESFQSLVAGAKRCRNLLSKERSLAEEDADSEEGRQERLRDIAAERFEAWIAHVDAGKPLDFDRELFVDEAETALYGAVVEGIDDLRQARDQDDAGRAYRSLAGFGPGIDRYFDEVLVNAPEPGLRRNRLGFLRDIHYLFAYWADLSQVPSA
jgi:glycyl-tRNA synthetase beta chain